MKRRVPEVLPLVLTLSVSFVLVLRAAFEWRFFDQFLGDDGWPLRVADRVAAGERLYTDVGWDYGPLPVYVLASLFRLSRSAAWASLSNLLLSGAAVCAVYVLVRDLAGRRAAGLVTTWTTLLGASSSLVSYLWDAYTPSVAWGTTTSLLAAAAASWWVRTRSPAALCAATACAAASVLSKPEFGLAGASVLVAAVVLARPRRRLLVLVTVLVAVPVLIAALRAGPSTLAAWWRGYSGYDLLREGTVSVTAGIGLLGYLLVPVVIGIGLWWRTAGRVLAAAGLVLVLVWLRDVVTGSRSLTPATNDILSATWLGVLPGLFWVGWRARTLGLPPVFWILWTYAAVVNLRFFFIGSFCPAAAGPAVALAFCALRRGAVARPTRAGLVVLAAVVLVPAFASEKRALSKPMRAVPVETPLGTVRVPGAHAATIAEGRALLDGAPAGPLFVSGGGPAWYVLSGRRNPTRFDVVITGLGTTEPEVTELLDDLRADPPAVVILERGPWSSAGPPPERLWAALGSSYVRLATTRNGRWEMFVSEHARTGAGGSPRPSTEGLRRRSVRSGAGTSPGV